MNTSANPKLVYKCEFDELTAYDVEYKGWFDAVAVILPDGIEIPMALRDPVRLTQDLEYEVAAGKCCVAEPALIVVPKITEEYMVKAVNQLYREGFFDRLIAIGQAG